MILSLCGTVLVLAASAQISFGVNGNYSKYAGTVSKSAPGFGVRASYEQERYAGVLAFTNGFAITEKGTRTVTNAAGNSKEVASEGRLTFKTISFIGNRTLIGDEESTGKFYLGLGASFVMAKYTEAITGSYDNSYKAPEMNKESNSGLTINGLLGGEYKIGMPSLFAEAGVAIPANQMNNSYIENVIPAHFIINVGVKFTLGGDN